MIVVFLYYHLLLKSYSMVIDEALIRLRPVIIFKEIENIIGKRKGIFISERNHKIYLVKLIILLLIMKTF